MAIKWQPSNINLFGTRALDLLFTRRELATGQVEPDEQNTDAEALDQERIDLIKSSYLKKISYYNCSKL